MSDIDTLRQRGIPFRALVDSSGVAVNGTKTTAQLRDRGMQPICEVDEDGETSDSVTIATLRSRGIPFFCEVDEGGTADTKTVNQLRDRGIPPRCPVGKDGVAQGGTKTINELRDRGIGYFCPVDENGDETTLGGGVVPPGYNPTYYVYGF